jgi:hypothetical protein
LGYATAEQGTGKPAAHSVYPRMMRAALPGRLLVALWSIHLVWAHGQARLEVS